MCFICQLPRALAEDLDDQCRFRGELSAPNEEICPIELLAGFRHFLPPNSSESASEADDSALIAFYDTSIPVLPELPCVFYEKRDNEAHKVCLSLFLGGQFSGN